MALLLTLVLCLSPQTLLAQSSTEAEGDIAGHVIVTRGDVMAMEATGQTRSLQRRSEVYVGDTIFTLDNAYTQMRMVDGAHISLSEFTEFAIVEYSYEQDPNSDSVVIDLLHGGFRTITGSISEANRSAYEARIGGFAFIGIRGTDYEVVVTPQGEIITGVYDGGTTFSNNIGTLDLGIGADFDFGLIENPQSPPVGLLQQPAQLVQIALNATASIDDDDQDDDADGDDGDRQLADGDGAGDNGDSSADDRDSGSTANSLAASGTDNENRGGSNRDGSASTFLNLDP
ncbi:MAG: FecR domain-containing protein, partial [Gammaproteobacteria bacterium]